MEQSLRIYEHFIEQRLEGLPLEEIPEVVSYLHRHWIEYLLFLDMMAAPEPAEELCQNESCKRDFLMYKIHQEVSNPNIGLLLSGIYKYIADKGGDLEWEK